MEKKPQLSKRDQEAARKYGGADTYTPPTTDPTYYDKINHWSRSVVHQPSHIKHKPNGETNS
jgi:hypothetical protein